VALYPRLVRNVTMPLALLRRGELAQLRWQREFERTQHLSADELRRLQWLRLRALLAHAYERCPIYRERFAAAGFRPQDLRGPENLRALPALEKRDLQEQGDRLLARGWPANDLIRNQTGGSTGQPVTFYLSRDRKCSRAAATLRHNRWAGWEVGDRAAVIWGAPTDRPPPGWRSRLRELLLAEPLWLDAGGLTEQTLEEFHHALHRRRPRVILAYARAAVLFAKYLQATGRTPYGPASLVTSAEVLEADDRALLARTFGCPVFNRYGCREVSVVASECPAHAGMHVMAEGLYLEIETPAGPAVPGRAGAVVVTDLLNFAMPLIRYRIGDMAAWASGDCPCGRQLPRLAHVAGRVTDFLVGDDGRLVSGVFLATYVVAHRPSLGRVQLHQSRAGAVLCQVQPGPGFDPEADATYLRTATRRHLGPRAEVEVEVVGELSAAASGKFLFSRSTVTPNFLQGCQSR
jgi:phenylacetate-CoA ligase